MKKTLILSALLLSTASFVVTAQDDQQNTMQDQNAVMQDHSKDMQDHNKDMQDHSNDMKDMNKDNQSAPVAPMENNQ